MVWNNGRLDYSELPNNLPSDVKGEYFPKETEKFKSLGSLMGKEVENLESHGKTRFIKANLGETLSLKTRTLFFSNLPLTWRKSAGLVHSWVSYQN